jgi:flavin-dependent dehydrogenase
VTEVDVLIVGAGPAGLFGAYYAGFRGLRVAVGDSLPELPGRDAALGNPGGSLKTGEIGVDTPFVAGHAKEA